MKIVHLVPAGQTDHRGNGIIAFWLQLNRLHMLPKIEKIRNYLKPKVFGQHIGHI